MKSESGFSFAIASQPLSIISHCANDQLDIGGLLYSDRLKFTGGITKEVQNDTKENISADGGDTQQNATILKEQKKERSRLR